MEEIFIGKNRAFFVSDSAFSRFLSGKAFFIRKREIMIDLK